MHRGAHGFHAVVVQLLELIAEEDHADSLRLRKLAELAEESPKIGLKTMPERSHQGGIHVNLHTAGTRGGA